MWRGFTVPPPVQEVIVRVGGASYPTEASRSKSGCLFRSPSVNPNYFHCGETFDLGRPPSGYPVRVSAMERHRPWGEFFDQ